MIEVSRFVSSCPRPVGLLKAFSSLFAWVRWCFGHFDLSDLTSHLTAKPSSGITTQPASPTQQFMYLRFTWPASTTLLPETWAMGQRCSEQIFHGNSQGLELMMLMILPLVLPVTLRKARNLRSKNATSIKIRLKNEISGALAPTLQISIVIDYFYIAREWECGIFIFRSLKLMRHCHQSLAKSSMPWTHRWKMTKNT